MKHPKGDLIRTALSIKFDVRIARELSQIAKWPIQLVVDDPTIRIGYNPID